jgi:hypothetical protein
LAGIDPLSFARAEDDLELQYLIQAAQSAIKWQAEFRKEQAALTIHYLGKSLGAKDK